jgi:alpha-beta hydrolase superfamily lysophospholipase
MKQLRTYFSLPIFLVILSLIAGCSAPAKIERKQAPAYDAKAWEARINAPPELKRAFREAKLEFVPLSGRADIPVRVFGIEGPKTPVIMAHGLQSHSGWFAQSAAYIAGLGHPVYSMDRRGSGLSRAPRGDSKDFQEMIEDIRTVADMVKKRHARERIYMLGHCFGAIPATAYACAYPGSLEGLLLTTPAIYTKTSIPFTYQLKILFTRSGRRDYMIPSPLETWWFTELGEYEEFIKSDDLSLKQASGDFYYQVHRARKYIHKNSDHLNMPIFVAIAAEDPICNNRRNKGFFDKLPARDKTLIEYEDARHILEYSPERERYFSDLADWLERHKET